MGNKPICSFKDLLAWQEAHRLILSLYAATQRFPLQEQYGLTNQIRRAGVSITSNIAEGFGRETYKEKQRFYTIASASLCEVENQLLIAKDIGYLPHQDYKHLDELTQTSSKLLKGLIKATRARA